MKRAISIEKYKDSTVNLSSGDIFLCIPEAEPYIKKALNLGASCVIKQERQDMAAIASTLYNHPSKHLKVIGVTGTNGKTTVTHLISRALSYLHKKVLLIGTITHPLTTPGSFELQKELAHFVSEGGNVVVMEVSSHGIHQKRIDSIDFDVKVLTNITHDHLDYHHTFEDYKQVKLSFMNQYPGYACLPEEYLNKEIPFEHQLKGQFNEENMKAAMAALQALGISDEDISSSLSQALPPKGRFECIQFKNKPLVIIDYAHTPDGLRVVSEEAKKLSNDRHGKLYIVFGCGGDRDKEKRPKMGKVASDSADVIILTSDNPRFEDPDKIIEEIQSGISGGIVYVYKDREEAIQKAILEALPEDVILVAGKGHETVQIIGSEKIPFDDTLVVTFLMDEKNENLN